MSINRINEIGREKGREAALAYAIISQASFKVRQAIGDGTWNFDGKPVEAVKVAPKPAAPKYAEMRPLRTMPARIGKTAKSGGLAASQKRKREKAENDRQIRARMKSANGKGK